MFYVYILRLKNNTRYVGKTSDLKRRIGQHKKGLVQSTKSGRPMKLIYYEAYQVKEDASDRELFLKTGDGRAQIKKQLKYTIDLQEGE